MGSTGERIVVLIDMDCFFCQVETKLQPEYVGKPLAVVQYNQWQMGGIIAVNYEAREFGVTRHMRGEEAKEKCPDLVLASVPCLRGKSDTSRYRTAGRDVVNVIKMHCNLIERASVDEAYLDITEEVEQRMSAACNSPKQLFKHLSNTFIVGYSEIGKNDEEERAKGMETWLSNSFQELEDTECQKLAIAGVIVEEIRSDVFEKTGFRCSAGIARNKILAKLACGLHKPNRQTILPRDEISALYSKLPIKKVRNLGGKFGDVVIESLNCNVMGDLLQYSLEFLQKRFDDKTGLWLYNIARGVDNEPVTMRLVSKSIGACKNFRGKQAIISLDVLKHWSGELAAEVCERLEQDLEENERRATLLTVCYHYYRNDKNIVTQSRSCTLASYKPEKMASLCVDIITKSARQCPVAFIGLSVGKFVKVKGSENFKNFFKPTSGTGETTRNSKSPPKTVTASFSNTKEPPNPLKNIKDTKTEKRDVPQNHETVTRSGLEILSDINVDNSPTSRRVNSLIEFLNGKQRSRVRLREEAKATNCTSNIIEKSLCGDDEIKESFFMNVFNKNENERDLEEFNDNAADGASATVQMEHEELSENEMEMDAIEDNNIDIDYRTTEEDLIVEKDIKDDDTEEFRSDKLNLRMLEEERQQEQSSALENQSGPSTALQTSSVRLREIFPDLSNIDPDIVSMLPLDLQNEAKLYMKTPKAPNKSNAKATENLVKTAKPKSNKSKVKVSKGKKGNNMYAFLIKTSTSTDSLSTKRCTQCNRMIPETKYGEHVDFHMAENLQRQLNDPSFNADRVTA